MSTRNFLMGYDDNSPDRLFMSILPDFIRDVENAHLRNRVFSALVKEQGNMIMNCGGNGFGWPIYARKHTMRTYTAQSSRTFTSLDPIERAYLNYAGYEVTDVMSERERKVARNSGAMALTNYYDEFSERLQESIMDQLGPQHFVDSSVAGNEEKWSGLKTLFQTDGKTLNVSSGVARTAHQDDPIFNQTGTYAGLRTDLGFYGGDIETGKVFPFGEMDSEYDFFSPLTVVGNSHYFDANNGSSTHTWFEQGEEVMDWTMTQLRRNALEESRYYILCGRDYYNELKNAQRDKQRIIVNASDDIKELGFGPRSFTIADGVTVILEYDISETEAIVVDTACCELRCMGSQMLEIPDTAPWYDEDNDRWKFAVSNLSNWKFKSPRNFAQIKKFDTLASG